MEPVCCCLCLLFCCVICVLAIVASSAGGFEADSGRSTLGARRAPPEEVLQSFGLLNQLRAEGFTCPGGQNFQPNGTPLQFDCALFWAAQTHSEDMAKNGFFDHFSDGQTPQDRGEAQGSPVTGENIAKGQSKAYEALDAWKASDDACINLMDPSHKLAAVGYAGGDSSGATSFLSSSSGDSHYWTQMLADSSIPVDTSCVPTDMQLYDHLMAPASVGIVGEAGKTWRAGDVAPAATASNTGGFKFFKLGQ